MLIDTHCHLDAAEFDADRAEAAARACAAGVRGVLVPAVEVAGFGETVRVAHATPGGAYALGIHPIHVDRAHDDDLDRLRDAVRAALPDPRFVGIGEIGLDHFVPGLDRVRQARFLDAQLRIAREFDLPVVLHVRRAQDPILGALRRIRVRGGIAHAFNGSRQQAEAYAALGFALGIGGAMTDPRALRIRALATEMPLDTLVLETDAPDIPPLWRRGERNAPEELPRIAGVLAELRGIATDEVAGTTGVAALRSIPRFGAALAVATDAGVDTHAAPFAAADRERSAA